jgi:VCBS repeat-containing protein
VRTLSINLPPVAAIDSYSTGVNTPLNQAAPGVLSNDSDPEGAPLTAQLVSGPAHGSLMLNVDGSFSYTPAESYVGSDSFTYSATDGSATSNIATVSITVTSTGGVLFSDDFTRSPDVPDPLSPWINALGTWTVTDGVLQGSGANLAYSNVYLANTPLWSDYSLEGRIKFPAMAIGGGLGGRVNPATGAHYGVWVYPDDGSGIDTNVLKLIKFRDWSNWNFTPMQQVDLPNVGTDWHALKMVFNGSRIQVYYDGSLMIDVTDNNFDSRAPYLTGGISGDMWTYTSPYLMELDNIVVRSLASSTMPTQDD